MIVFVQPFGLSSPAGGPRILRALLTNATAPFVSVCASPGMPPRTHVGREVHLPVRPHLGRVENTRLTPLLGSLGLLFADRFRDQLDRICGESRATAVHTIPQG